MDPSAIKCSYKNSFDQTNIPIVLHNYVNLENTNLEKHMEMGNSDSVNIVNPEGNKTKLTDPFYDVSYQPFLSRDTITLANIDGVFNFSKHMSGYIMPQETKDFTFATLDDAPGHFTQYMLYRNPNSYGYGITRSNIPFDNSIDITHFNIMNGEIMKNYKKFVEYVKTVEVEGVDAVVGNYYYYHDRNDCPNKDENNQYNIRSEGYLVRLLTTLGIIAIGGSFVCKVSNITEPLMMDLLWITSKCFDKITLFKPISTPSNDGIYYLVAENAKTNNIEWIGYLEESYQEAKKYEMGIKRLFKSDLPSDFRKWVEEYDTFIKLYNNYLDSQNPNYKIIDTYKCKAIWNLPQL